MSKIVSNNCLVLGGGGVTGIAWMTGLIYGLQLRGLELSAIDRVIGTSAGAAVAAQITSSTSLHDLYQRQVDPVQQVDELIPSINIFALVLKLLPILLTEKNPEKFRQRIGKLAMNTKTTAASERQKVIAARLPNQQWPATALTIMAVDANSGTLISFDKDHNIALIDAVAASCAVPGVWPPVAINNQWFIDGGTRSANNADLACGAKNVLVIAPMGDKKQPGPSSNLEQEVELLRKSGSAVTVIKPDSNAVKMMGRNPLNPRKRAQAALAGKQQGEREASRVLMMRS
ncbi:MAG: patatin-like phospholipase family protein [Spongiibacteraceae bacterium]